MERKIIIFQIIIALLLLIVLVRGLVGKSLIWTDDYKLQQALNDQIVLGLIDNIKQSTWPNCSIFNSTYCDALSLRLQNLGLYSPWVLRAQDAVEGAGDRRREQDEIDELNRVKCLADGKC